MSHFLFDLHGSELILPSVYGLDEEVGAQFEIIDPDYNFFEKDLPNTYIAPSDFYKLPKLPHKLSFLHINCRSISNKVQDIITLNSLMKAKIIAVTETWLNPDTSESIFIPDYSFNSVYRCSGRGRCGSLYSPHNTVLIINSTT